MMRQVYLIRLRLALFSTHLEAVQFALQFEETAAQLGLLLFNLAVLVQKVFVRLLRVAVARAQRLLQLRDGHFQRLHFFLSRMQVLKIRFKLALILID